MLEELKAAVCAANLELVAKGVVTYTWGNVSGCDRSAGIMIIKPSGVPYESMAPEDMVLVDIETGNVIEGNYRPSSDTPTHLELYRSFPQIGGVSHTHSVNAVAFAQAGVSVPALGTTHADCFRGDVPCTRQLTEDEVMGDYELNTGKVITETYADLDPMAIPAVLVQGHGPFAWGKTPAESVYNAVTLEKVAEMAAITLSLNPKAHLPKYVLEKHYLRKHGNNAYYGQI